MVGTSGSPTGHASEKTDTCPSGSSRFLASQPSTSVGTDARPERQSAARHHFQYRRIGPPTSIQLTVAKRDAWRDMHRGEQGVLHMYAFTAVAHLGLIKRALPPQLRTSTNSVARSLCVNSVQYSCT